MSKADWLRLIFLSLLWGGSFFFVGIALAGGLPPLVVVLARVGFGALVLGGVLVLRRMPFPRGGGVWRALLVMGLLNNVVPFSLFAFAQGEIGAGLAAILNAMTPLFTVLVAHALAAERITPARIAGVVLGFGGVLVMMQGEALGGTLLAKLACLGAALSYACAGVWGRRFRTLGIAPLATAFGQCACAAGVMLPVVLVVNRPWTLAMPEGGVIAAVAGLVLLSTALGYLLFFRLLASAGALNAQLVTFLIPASAVLLGVVFLGETLAPKHLAGAALIGLGLVAIDGRVPARLARRFGG